MKIVFSVRSGRGTVQFDGTFTDVVDVVQRRVRFHHRWQSVQYHGKRYRLAGGIRTDYFIVV